MPIPFIIAGVAAVAGAYGAKKSYDAYQDNEEAERINLEAKNLYDEALHSLEKEKESTQESLESLGNLKLNMYEELIIPTIDMLNRMPEFLDNKDFIFSGKKLKLPNQNDNLEMKEYKTNISEIVSGGVKALGTGGLIGLATYGGVGTFAVTTTTGTAIASLSGVAATNATFAWLGGGALSAGGLGIAGGTAILGGIVAAPVLAIGGMIYASKAEESKNNAYSNLQLAKIAVEELELAKVRTNAIRRKSNEIMMTLENIKKNYIKKINDIKEIIYEKGIPQNISERSIKTFFIKKEYLSWNDIDLEKIVILDYFYKTTINILEIDLIQKDGSTNPEIENKLREADELSK